MNTRVKSCWSISCWNYGGHEAWCRDSHKRIKDKEN